jgi:hypothetical protein
MTAIGTPKPIPILAPGPRPCESGGTENFGKDVGIDDEDASSEFEVGVVLGVDALEASAVVTGNTGPPFLVEIRVKEMT